MEKHYISKRILLIAVVVLVFLALFTGFKSSDEEIFTVRVADLPVVHALPFYVALERGYFEEAGIEIEYVKLDSPNLIIDALISNKVDMTTTSGAMGIAGIAEFKEPGTLKIYAATGGDTKQRNESLMVTQDSGIASFADLQGKRMGILPGIQWRTISKHLLKTYGLIDAVDVELVELAPGLQVAALESGQIDALLAIEPMATVAEHAGFKEIVRSPNTSAISNPFYPGAGVVRRDFADAHTEEFQKIIQVLNRALVDIARDPEGTLKYLTNYTALSSELAVASPIMRTKLYTDFTAADIDAIQKFYDVFTEYGVVDGIIDAQEIVYK